MRESCGSEDGFTLLEVTFIVLVLGILVSIAVSSYAVSSERSLRVVCQENVRVLDMAVRVYEQQRAALPTSLADLGSQVKGRTAYSTCPDGDRPYIYDPNTGQVTCPIHPLR